MLLILIKHSQTNLKSIFLYQKKCAVSDGISERVHSGYGDDVRTCEEQMHLTFIGFCLSFIGNYLNTLMYRGNQSGYSVI